MTASRPDQSNTAPEPPHKVCYLSRRRGWTDPGRPRRPVSEVNLLAVYLGSPVWTLETAWAAVFDTFIPPPVARAYRTATARVSVSEDEVRLLQEVADRLHVELRVID